jgi:hypothetical protein
MTGDEGIFRVSDRLKRGQSETAIGRYEFDLHPREDVQQPSGALAHSCILLRTEPQWIPP